MKWKLLTLSFLSVSFFACSPSVPKKQMVALEKKNTVTDHSDLEIWNPKLDILFVIDNSGSMSEHQRNLAQNIGQFVSNFSSRISIDFHIGVISTDKDSIMGVNCCGVLIGQPAYLTGTESDFATNLKKRMLLGISGSGLETVFDPLHLALREPNFSGPNAGFLRSDAYFAVIVITDAEDQSELHTAKDTYQLLLDLKAGQNEKVLGYGVLVPSGEDMCPRDSGDEPKQIERFLGMVVNSGKNIYSLCDPNFGDRLVEISKDIVARVGNVYRLLRQPQVNTISVTYGKQIIPRDSDKGWSFDPFENSIILGPNLELTEQPPGTQVQVKYEAVPE